MALIKLLDLIFKSNKNLNAVYLRILLNSELDLEQKNKMIKILGLRNFDMKYLSNIYNDYLVKYSLQSALYNAATSEMIRLYLDAGAEINDIELYGKTLLMKESEGYFPLILETLIRFRADLNIKDKWGATALMYAVRKGSLIKAKILVEAGANLYIKDINDNTVLDIAKLNELNACERVQIYNFLEEIISRRNLIQFISLVAKLKSDIFLIQVVLNKVEI